ncbi:MAG: hypothetical protein CVV28_11765 [Methanobacteriales archaeon HGW-Methanobacteriales-1]|jgi:uncharacterized protein YpmB|nr:MAG: hypothetical protein CVV28_11765 [Methanobacteriales archaeon HGW-Methanobacteriales-1]
MDRNLIIVAAIVIIIVAVAGAWYVMQPASVNNTANNTTNGTIYTNISNDTNNTIKNNTTNSTNITKVQANKLASKYIGMGVYLGNNTTLTTYKKVKVWNVSVYTTQGLYSSSIYINVRTGKRVQ